MQGLIARIRGQYAAKLLVVFALIAVLVGGFSLGAAQAVSDTAASDARAGLSATATDRATAVEQWAAGIEAETARLATRPAVTEGSTAEIEAVLSRYGTDTSPGVVGVVYLADGDVVASTDGVTLPTAVADAAAGGQGYTESFQQSDRRLVGYAHAAGDGTIVTVVDPTRAVPAAGGDAQRTLLVDDTTVVGAVGADAAGATLASGVDLDTSGTNGADGGAADHDGATVQRVTGDILVDDTAGGAGDASAAGDTSGASGDQFVAAASVGDAPWTLVVAGATQTGTGSLAVSAIGGVALLALVSLLLFGSTVGSTTVIQTSDLEHRAGRVADGELDVEFPTRRADEFGVVRDSMDQMRKGLIEKIEAAESAQTDAERERQRAETLSTAVGEIAEDYASELERAADGDLTVRVDVTGSADDTDADAIQDMRRIGEAVNTLLAEYESRVREVSAFADDVATASRDMTDATEEATAISSEMSEQLSDIQTDASQQRDEIAGLESEIDQLSATAEEVAATASEVETVSQTAAEAAREGASSAERALSELDETVATINDTVGAIDELADRVDQVTAVVETIAGIADETDMLAVNATIEAAHAGSGNGGDGFAVVAEEVKSLAEETKESAAEIESQLEAIREQTATAVESADEADATVSEASETIQTALGRLDDIRDSVEQTDDSVSEIARAIEEQAESTQTASSVARDVREISERTAADADESAAAASEQTEIIRTVAELSDSVADDADDLTASLADLTVSDGDGTTSRTGRAGSPVTVDDD
ncbi:methyl-accepting chemotaxis protein [Halobaculum sp. MBLA0143]|uniref:methyl-accepting chemotaxis protein n=1 Tax=Halobaculum sp. MBLA0143 TaxID=3079933 RepID=UPI003524ED52